MKFIGDGNITTFFQYVFLVCGLFLVWVGFYFFGDDFLVKMSFFSVGIFIAGVGGYSARADTMGLRPFDVAPWRRARKTYDESPVGPKEK